MRVWLSSSVLCLDSCVAGDDRGAPIVVPATNAWLTRSLTILSLVHASLFLVSSAARMERTAVVRLSRDGECVGILTTIVHLRCYVSICFMSFLPLMQFVAASFWVSASRIFMERIDH